ncbi:MAG: hypothetical protein MZV64_49830 [Ignavibacteriales bacterium]|nr:hypothetical protein [Ignavibacteriales bacterium]
MPNSALFNARRKRAKMRAGPCTSPAATPSASISSLTRASCARSSPPSIPGRRTSSSRSAPGGAS